MQRSSAQGDPSRRAERLAPGSASGGQATVARCAGERPARQPAPAAGPGGTWKRAETVQALLAAAG